MATSFPIDVPFYEVPGGSERYNESGDSAVRILLCDYDKADRLCQQLRGYTTILGTNSFIRYTPHTHPKRPYLYVKSAEFEGLGVMAVDPFYNNEGLATYQKAKITVEYGPLEQNPGDAPDQEQQVYMTEDVQGETTMVTVPSGCIIYDGGFNAPSAGDVVAQWVHRRIPFSSYTLTVHRWPNPNFVILDELSGKVNRTRFRALFRSFGKDTVLYERYSLERDFFQTISGTSVSAFRVSLSFKINPYGWNRMLDIDGRFYPVVNLLADGSNTPLYESANLNQLLP